jgi:hypothetical protein
MPRNANATGTLRRRMDGRWEGRLRAGERVSVHGRTKAEAKLSMLRKDVETLGNTLPERLPFATRTAEWLAEQEHHLRPRTLLRYYQHPTYRPRALLPGRASALSLFARCA